MTKESVSYKDLYSLLDERTNQILAKFEALECRVGILERFKDKSTVYVTIAVGIITIAWTLTFDWVKKILRLNV